MNIDWEEVELYVRIYPIDEFLQERIETCLDAYGYFYTVDGADIPKILVYVN